MKKSIKPIIVVICLALPLHSLAQTTQTTDVNERLRQMEQQIKQLEEQSQAAPAQAGAKYPVDLYGFVAAQFFWGTAKTQLYGGLNSMAAQSRVTDKATIAGDNAWFGATPQNSRIGLNWTGSKVGEKTYIGGIAEIDFVNVLNTTNYGTSPIPRIRHLSLSLWGDKWLLLAGQNWDIFSPLNTNSLSLGNNIWYQGNMGFRRPQLRFTYKFLEDDKDLFQGTISANHPANTDDLWNGSTDGAFPYGEWAVQYSRKVKEGEVITGISGAVGGNRVSGRYAKTWGIAASLAIPLHKILKLSGEFQYGCNLGNFLTYAGTTADIKDMAGWGQIYSNWHPKFDTTIGYGVDNMARAHVAAAGVQRNQIFFGNFRFKPFKPFYFGVEYDYMRTNYRGDGTSTASVIFSNIVYSF